MERVSDLGPLFADLDFNAGINLIQFIDSDQEFCDLVAGEPASRRLYAINYCHQLDRTFSLADVAILTGKVVGEPPVSPAVITSNFLDDVVGFPGD